MKSRILTFLCCYTLIIVACSNAGQENVGESIQGVAQVNAQRAQVFARSHGQEDPLSPGQATLLQTGDGLRVGGGGHALLRVADLASVELLDRGNLQVRELSLDGPAPLVVFQQRGGVFVNEVKLPAGDASPRLEVQSSFARINARDTRFLLARESDAPLEWLWAIDAAGNDLIVSAQGVTRTATSGLAYWIAPVGAPSQAIEFDPDRVAAWLDALREGTFPGEVGDVLWRPADDLLTADGIEGAVAPGRVVTLGDISIRLAAGSASGPAAYAQTDCNQDGALDIAMTNGRLLFDLRAVAGRVRAVDVTVTGWKGSRGDDLRVFDPAYERLDYSPNVVRRRNDTVVGVRSRADQGEAPYHYAELRLADGCFLGVSLTPPQADGTHPAPRPAIPEAQCTVSAAGLNLRRGPDTSFAPPIRLLRRGDRLVPLGRTASGGWIRVQTAAGDVEGWVSANPQFVACTPATATLPILVAPPTPASNAPAPTPTPPQATPAARAWQAPQLLEPADGASFGPDSVVTLRWAALPATAQGRGPGVARRLPQPSSVDVPLWDDEYYQVIIHFSPSVDAVWTDVHLVKDNKFVVPAYLNSREMSWDQRYTWSVVVVQRPPMGEARPLGPESKSRVFYWNLGARPTLTAPPQRTATPVPTPIPTATPVSSPSATATQTPAAVETPTAIATQTPAAVETPTATATQTPAAVGTPTVTATQTPAAVETPTATATSTLVDTGAAAP